MTGAIGLQGLRGSVNTVKNLAATTEGYAMGAGQGEIKYGNIVKNKISNGKTIKKQEEK